MAFDLRNVEKSLLSGRRIDQDARGEAVDIANQVVDGAFHSALTSSQARKIFAIRTDILLENIDQPLNTWFEFSDGSTEQGPGNELICLALAVACLHTFIQANWTGPDPKVRPLDVLDLPPALSQTVTEDAINQKSIAELACGGEPAYHLADAIPFLRLAHILLAQTYRYCESAPWWRLRTWLVHLQVLDEAVSVPEDVLASLAPLSKGIASDPDFAGRLEIEQGLLEHHVSNEKAAAEHFINAAKSTGLQYELTGALGKRTKFQQNDLSQLVLLAESRPRPSEEAAANLHTSDVNADAGSSTNIPQTLSLHDDTLLEKTEFTSTSVNQPGYRLSHIDPSAQPSLHPLDQCILLSLCLNVRNTSPSHGLTNEQMSPYVARVISHPNNWSVHTMALLLRSRLENSRTRTVERSTLQLQALVDQMPTADSTVSERLLHIHDIPLPSKWDLQKELAMQLLSLGAVRSALEIFERLEMWEEVVKCWQAMEQPDKGIAIVRDLLEGRKEEANTVLVRGKVTSSGRRQTLDAAREAKLWCLLGDLEPQNALEHYAHAWEVSKGTSGRAMRSLGGYHFARGQFAEAIPYLRRAVAINPLQHRAWFVLGCACVREEDWEGARQAFARCISIDDEDGESWNNLASVYLRMSNTVQSTKEDENGGEKQPEEGSEKIPFSHKMLAFRALQHGLKYRYEDWRMWYNYMVVATDVGELSEACRALTRIVEERAAKDGAASVDEDVLERLVTAVTRAPSNPDDAVEGEGTAEQAALNPSEGHGLFRRVSDLFERTILPRISSSPRIFRAYARLLTWQTRYSDALKAYLDGYRCSVAGDMEKGETDVEKWREAVREVQEVVDVLRNFGPRAEGFKWELQARSVVRTFMGRTRENFDDEREWKVLEELTEELRKEE